jgi:AcrR family transcriptional regulator
MRRLLVSRRLGGRTRRRRGGRLGAPALAQPARRRLSLRAVARRVGITAASVYSHFSDLDALVTHVLEQRYADLAATTVAATRTAETPLEELVARCWAYARWGLDHPGHYRVVFGGRTSAAQDALPGGNAGQELLDGLTDALASATVTDPLSDQQRWRNGLLLWTGLHGIVSLANDKAGMPWPPIDTLVIDLITLHTRQPRESVGSASRRFLHD